MKRTGSGHGGVMARLLVCTATAGFRHESIPAGVAALRRLGAEIGADVDQTEGELAGLEQYDAVVFLSTSGPVLSEASKAALQRYMQAGGSWLGIHAASTTEYDWPWYGGLVGAWFDQHPRIQTATMTVEDQEHPATRHLGATWTWRDEWYAFRTDPRPDVRVLLSVDETSYDGGTMGTDHPIAWCHDYGGGRSFYTALGHTEESFSEPEFLRHLGGAIDWLVHK